MRKKFTRLLLGLFIGVLGSIAILFLLHSKEGKKSFSFKKLFSMHMLEQLSQIYDTIIDGIPDDEKNIVSNIVRALKSLHSLYEQLFQVKRMDKFMKFIEHEGFELSNNEFILPLVRNTRLRELVEVKDTAFDLGSGMFVRSITFPDGDKVYTTNIIEPEDSPRANRRVSDADNAKIAVSPGFNMNAKLDMFWKFYQAGIFIRSVDEYEHANFSDKNDNLVIEDLSTIDYKFYGKSQKYLDRFTKKVMSFRGSKVQRSYLLLGKPGTGKSTFSIEVSRRISNRVIKISADLFRSFDREDIDFIFKCLRPDSVIVDDFDRVYDDMADADMLYFFEQLKTTYHEVTVFCTVNNIRRLGEAMIRPGRFDEIVVFNLPDPKDRKVMLEAFIAELQLEKPPSEQQMEKLVEVTDGFSPAYLREYCLQLKHDPNFKELVRRITMTKQFVDSADFGSGDLDEM